MSIQKENLYKIPANGVYGSGSSRKSPRNCFVAEFLGNNNLATLLFDLVTEKEDKNYSIRFDISLLTDRLVTATKWLLSKKSVESLKRKFFGSSTGAAAILRASAKIPSKIDAIVSRGGRLDLASEILDQLRIPTLFIVGGKDTKAWELNKRAIDKLPSMKKLEVVEGAGHLFEEPGKLEEVARLASEWFSKELK